MLPGHNQRGTVSALAIGHRESISTRQWAVLKRTGTNHLMAISGLHIGLVSAGGFFLILWLWSRSARACWMLAAPRAGAIGGLLLAFCYAGLADFSIPTQRALIMIALVMVNIVAGRRSAPTSVLAAALLGVLLVDPFSVLSAGFWLSFAAVAVILVAVCGRTRGEKTRDQRSFWYQWWWRWGSLQLLVAMGLAPLTLILFSQVSIVAPLANTFAVPWVGTIVVPLTLGGVALMPISGDLGAYCLLMAAQALDHLWWLLEKLDGLELVLDTIATLDVGEMLVLLLLAALWLLPPGVPGRWLAVFVFPLLLCRAVPAPAPGGLELTVLDVGQGLSVVARTSRHTLVFDTGPRYASGLDTGQLVVVPFLRDRSVRSLDVLLISHGDNDHAGGVASVVGAIDTNRVMTNADLPLESVSPCMEGERWVWDGVEFEVLGPPRMARSDNNNNFCVLRIVTASWQILVPGDIERQAEEELVYWISKRLDYQLFVYQRVRC